MALGSRRARLMLAVVAAGFALAGPPASARLVPGDALLCAGARAARGPRSAPPLPAFHPRVGVTVIDRFTRPVASERYTLDLRKAEAFCEPVRIDGDIVSDPLHGLEVYEARRTRRKPAPPPLPATTETVETSFGSVRVRVGSVEALAVPTMATGSVGGTGPARDHFACYQVRPERGTGRAGALAVEVRTAESQRTVEVRKPTRLCVPASVRGEDPGAPKHPLDLLCYESRLARSAGEVPAAGPELVATRNAFGNEVLRLGVSRMLCVPAARIDVAVPTPTPFPTLTPPPTPVPTATAVRTPRPPALRIAPAAATTLVRDRTCFAAVMELPDGSTADVTSTALWRVADGTIAVPAGFLEGRKCFLGVGIGATTLSARDPVTGVTSAATGGDAALAAEWPAYRLSVSPDEIGLRAGDAATVTVTADLTGDRTRNVTQHVSYASADPAVASAPNASGNRSRIQAVGNGRTTITVTDPLSSLATTMRVVVADLQSILVDPGPYLLPGESARLTATGFFGGYTSNLTQTASYESSDPGVVVATNAPGDRSRIEAVSPGRTEITAIDPLSGIRSTCCGVVFVLGDLLGLTVAPGFVQYRTGVDGGALAFAAYGTFRIPPNSSTSRQITERVTWSTSDPTVLAPNGVDPQGRPLFTAVGGGRALVVATDPASAGTGSAQVFVYDRLERVEVGTSQFDPAELKERTIAINESSRYYVWGYFDGGTPRYLDRVRLRVSDPTVAAIANGYVYGIAPGTVTVSAVDEPSGLASSDGGRDAVLHVVGDLERVELSPRSVTLDLGEATSLTALGHHVGGAVEPVTQRVVYTSSDPTVVMATNESGNRSRIVAVGGGTATISARDQATGVTSTASGDDTVVTVRYDPLVRVVVSPVTRRVPAGASPRFTAVGQLASGATQNLTQRVVWSSSAAAVATAANEAGDRSRIDTSAPGTTVVAAQDPLSGVASTDTGDDATLTVETLAALTLAPANVALAVGGAFSLTTVGIVTGGDPINVTQDAVYTSSDPGVARATNQPGNKSRIEAVAPGVATITAFRASAYPQATDSNAITVTVAPAP